MVPLRAISGRCAVRVSRCVRGARADLPNCERIVEIDLDQMVN
jgi:hypothetical protein